MEKSKTKVVIVIPGFWDLQFTMGSDIHNDINHWKAKSASHQLVSSKRQPSALLRRKRWWMASWLLQNVHCPPFSGGRSRYDMMVPHIDMAVRDTLRYSQDIPKISPAISPAWAESPSQWLQRDAGRSQALPANVQPRNGWRQRIKKALGPGLSGGEVPDPWGQSLWSPWSPWSPWPAKQNQKFRSSKFAVESSFLSRWH